MKTILSVSNVESEFGVSPISQEDMNTISGGIGFLGGAGAALLFAELYQWGYDYASSRLKI